MCYCSVLCMAVTEFGAGVMLLLPWTNVIRHDLGVKVRVRQHPTAKPLCNFRPSYSNKNCLSLLILAPLIAFLLWRHQTLPLSCYGP